MILTRIDDNFRSNMDMPQTRKTFKHIHTNIG